MGLFYERPNYERDRHWCTKNGVNIDNVIHRSDYRMDAVYKECSIPYEEYYSTTYKFVKHDNKKVILNQNSNKSEMKCVVSKTSMKSEPKTTQDAVPAEEEYLTREGEKVIYKDSVVARSSRWPGGRLRWGPRLLCPCLFGEDSASDYKADPDSNHKLPDAGDKPIPLNLDASLISLQYFKKMRKRNFKTTKCNHNTAAVWHQS